MLEVGLSLQGFIVWKLILIEATLPVVKLMEIVTKSLPEASEAGSIGSALFISDDWPKSLRPLLSRYFLEANQ